MANERDILIQGEDSAAIPIEREDELVEPDALPGDEVSVVRDETLAQETDNRGIVERLVDTVFQEDSDYIDRKSGPSI